MRLSKRQLKRIIREEYSLLKRRGLLKEGSASPDLLNTAGDYVSSLYDEGGEERWVIETLAYIFEEAIEEYSAMEDEEGEADDASAHVRELMDMYDPYQVVKTLCMMQDEVNGGNGRCDRSLQDFINKADQELGGIY